MVVENGGGGDGQSASDKVLSKKRKSVVSFAKDVYENYLNY